MKILVRLMLGASALAMAGCTQLPGSSLGATFSAERYLKEDHGGAGFSGALAKEYTELGRRAAFEDVRWRNSTAYINKAQAAEAGVAPPPWAPDQLNIIGDVNAEYDSVYETIKANADAHPAECARAQAMWDQYLEAIRADGTSFCISVEDARALFDEALAACNPSAPIGKEFVVFFGFDRTNLTDAARATLDEVSSAVEAMAIAAVSVIGHTDTVGSQTYNQDLSERRARRVANALVDRGVDAGLMTLAGRSENDLAVQTGDNVRNAQNRRVEITLSN